MSGMSEILFVNHKNSGQKKACESGISLLRL
jgi:hypothetical protein